jgi:SAM-dependent methyltransferase
LIRKLKEGFIPSPHRLWYNEWIKKNIIDGMAVLDVGKSAFWDYGFFTIDTNPILKPTFIGNIEKTSFPDKTFDVVLCNGMYEFVDNPQKMIDEVLRITKGVAIFGFVGKDYKPYREPWKYYEGKEIFPSHIKKDFDQEYHFIICQK